MSTLRLPDEVCEEIIDNCRSFMDGGDWSLEESYQVLRACSLACQAWLTTGISAFSFSENL
ncbi:hypothetical protein TRAPUB_7644 [Trametes pubescens]|uniref:Uncharacterized protein n=1 Tax=Trametes pubescens TaxID=154538 RepID=A0A1M2V2U4_TRAPU|nr:hypothetical protein TRAPUB_7644 [Trametes pubescens]